MAEYIEGITLNEKIPTDNFADLLRDLPDIYQDRDLFRYNGPDGQVVAVGAKEFQGMCAALGASFAQLGLSHKNVAVIGETSVPWIATYYAQAAGGGVIVPVDKDLPDEEIADVLRRSDAAAVVYAPSLAEAIGNIRRDLPEVRHFIPMEGDGEGSLPDLVRRGRTGAAAFLETRVDPDQLSSVLYTSGTTGRSKGVMLTHRNIFSTATAGLQLIRVGDTCLSTLPIHHAYELTHGITMMMLAGTTIALSESPRYFLRNLKVFKPVTVCLVPLYVEMIYKKVAAEYRQKGQDLADVVAESRRLLEQGIDRRRELFAPVHELLGGRAEVLISGGAPLSAFYVNAFDDFGINLLQGYGITECGPVVAVNPIDRNKAGAVGVVMPCSELRLTDVDEDGQGELWARGTNVMQGYYGDPEATRACMDGEWFDTGDIARVDDEGYYYITGRAKNLIVLANGKNVHPEEVEGHLSAIPTITEIIVYAPADEIGVQRELHAQIYVDDAARAGRTDEQLRADLEEAIADVNQRLPGYQQVASFILRDRPFDKTTKMSIQRFKIDTTA